MTPEFLRSILDYDPVTGIFTWKVPRGGKLIGSRAGYDRWEKTAWYRYIKIERQPYPEHRLAWFWMTGVWPERLDHEDLNGLNNKWVNLREATNSQNIANQTLRSDNTTGYKGIRLNARTGKWYSGITHMNRHYHLGTFATAAEAGAAHDAAALRFFGEFARNK